MRIFELLIFILLYEIWIVRFFNRDSEERMVDLLFPSSVRTSSCFLISIILHHAFLLASVSFVAFEIRKSTQILFAFLFPFLGSVRHVY